MKFYLIVSTVKPDYTDNIVDAAKEAGAPGATIIPARGVPSSSEVQRTLPRKSKGRDKVGTWMAKLTS